MQGAATITKANASPTPLAHQAIHDTVMRILANQPRGALLDVPAGERALAARLIDAVSKLRSLSRNFSSAERRYSSWKAHVNPIGYSELRHVLEKYGIRNRERTSR